MHEIPVVGPLWLNGLLCLLGFILHAVSAWDEYRRMTEKVGFFEYVSDNPSLAAKAVATAALAFIGAWAVGWMNPGMAMGCGYAGGDVVNRIIKRNEQIAESKGP